MRLKGQYRGIDLADKVQRDYVYGVEPGESTGMPALDPYYLVKRGQWTVVTGMPGHGKSTFVDNVMVSLAKRSGWRFLVCSPENQPLERHFENLLEIGSGRAFANDRLRNTMSPEELVSESIFVDKHFQFIAPDETEFHIEYILSMAEVIHQDWPFDGFLLDPYNELEHKRPPGMSETDYISRILILFRRFCRRVNVHGWLVAHPTKMKEINPSLGEGDVVQRKIYAMPSLYDIAGSANWRNKADMGIVVYRDFRQEPEKSIVSIQKVRFMECGRLGEATFEFNRVNKRFYTTWEEQWEPIS